MYIMIKKTLKERIEEAKKRNYLTLLEILDILYNESKKEKQYVKNYKIYKQPKKCQMILSIHM